MAGDHAVAATKVQASHVAMQPLAPYLERLPQVAFTVYGGLAAFFCYFAMYAFRKPFKAGSFEEHEYFAGTEMKFKTALVLAQLLGYMTSKFIGIKYVPEAKGQNVALHLLALITFAFATLVLYGALPYDWKVFAMFLNGLPLGVIWGLVVTFLEGRRTSNYMLAGLCCAFIVSSGAVKDVALWVMQLGVHEVWMPAAVAAMFYPLFVLCVWLLHQMPAPTAEDVAAQSERKSMSAQDRVNYFRSQGVGLALLLFGQMLLTAYRDYRDTFQTELFLELGKELEPGVFSRSESMVGFVILLVVGSLGNIESNKLSSQASILYLLLGSVIMFASVASLSAWPDMDAFVYMITTGLGSYLSYVPYNSCVYESLIAYTMAEATLSFPMALGDAVGYLGTLAVYLVNTFGAEIPYLDFFQSFGYGASIAGFVAYSTVYVYYFVVFPRRSPVCSDKGSEAAADREVVSEVASEVTV